MKKGLIISAICLVLLCGCKSKEKLITCTGETIDNNNKSTVTITAKLEKKAVVSVTADITYLDKETANQFYKMYELANSFAEREEDKYDVSLEGNTIKVHDYAFAYAKAGNGDLLNLSKEDFIKTMEKTNALKCK